MSVKKKHELHAYSCRTNSTVLNLLMYTAWITKTRTALARSGQAWSRARSRKGMNHERLTHWRPGPFFHMGFRQPKELDEPHVVPSEGGKRSESPRESRIMFTTPKAPGRNP